MAAYARTSGKRQFQSMRMAFLSKRPRLVSPEGSYQGGRNKWQILAVRHVKRKILGVYATPSVSGSDWTGPIAELKPPRRKGVKTVICGDRNPPIVGALAERLPAAMRRMHYSFLSSAERPELPAAARHERDCLEADESNSARGASFPEPLQATRALSQRRMEL